MKAYFLELRNSPLKWWFAVFVIMDLVAVFGRSRYWIGVWPQASAAVQVPSLFFAPVLAAAAAWAAGRSHRNQLQDQLRVAAIPSWRIDAVQLAASVTFGIAAYAVGALAAAAVSLNEAGPGFLWPGYVLLGASVIVASAAIGHLVGALSRSSLATPAICGLGLFVALGTTGRRAELFVLSGSPNERVAAVPLLARLVVSLGLVAMAILIPSLVRTPRFSAKSAVSFCLPALIATAAMALGVVGTANSGRLVVDRAAPQAFVCTNTHPKVCLWPEDRKYLPLATTMMERLNAIPAGILQLPEAFYEYGLRDRHKYSSDFLIAEGHPWSMSSGIASAIHEMTFPPYCQAINEVEEDRRLAARFDVGQWLESRLNGEGQPASVGGGRPGVDRQAIEELLKQPEEVQAEWVRQRVKIVSETRCAT
ncbi:hypothetical protein ACTMSW_21855 [Micromonospora sp. BQ11]|uniref:hypothetical protein n=1 Tax=Micromonospora sp. BQ11 TaxID=3452212 RepID=UPI003F8B62B2